MIMSENLSRSCDSITKAAGTIKRLRASCPIIVSRQEVECEDKVRRIGPLRLLKAFFFGIEAAKSCAECSPAA